MASKERRAQGALKLRQAMAGGGWSQMDVACSAGQAAAVGYGGNKPEIGQVIVHGFVIDERWFSILPIAKLLDAVFNGYLN